MTIDQRNSSLLTPPSQKQRPRKQKEKISLKRPSQERSRLTVQSVLEACSRLIAQKGFFGISTEMIAKEAGISIGSLYQFFGNKESVVSALIQDLFQKDRERLDAGIDQLLNLKIEDRIERFIDITIQLHEEQMDLRARIQHLQIYLSDSKFYTEKIKYYQSLLKLLIPNRPQDRDIEIMTQVMAQTLVGLLSTSRKETLDLRRNAVRDEIYRLFKGFFLDSGQDPLKAAG